MEVKAAETGEVYIQNPEKLDPERITRAIGPWKIYGWDKGFRFESPKIEGLPHLVMVIAKDSFTLQPFDFRHGDPRIYLRNVKKVEIHGHEIGIESDDGKCYVQQQGLKARVLYGKSVKGRTAEVSVSFGEPLQD